MHPITRNCHGKILWIHVASINGAQKTYDVQIPRGKKKWCSAYVQPPAKTMRTMFEPVLFCAVWGSNRQGMLTGRYSNGRVAHENLRGGLKNHMLDSPDAAAAHLG